MKDRINPIARIAVAALIVLGSTLGVAGAPGPPAAPAGAAGPTIIVGDGCWTGTRYYGYGRGTDSRELRIREAIKFWQRQLIGVGVLDADPTTLNGGFGPKTEQAVKELQVLMGEPQTGRVGRIEAAWMMRRVIDAYEARGAFNIPDHRLWAAASLESCFDPAAAAGDRSARSGLDRGTCQFNSRAFPNVTDEMAFNPDIALFLCATNFNIRYDRFKSGANRPPGPGERYFTQLSSGPYTCSTVECRDAANLSHLSPVYGADWARRRGPHPSAPIAAKESFYVDRIHNRRDSYPCATIGNVPICGTP